MIEVIIKVRDEQIKVIEDEKGIIKTLPLNCENKESMLWYMEEAINIYLKNYEKNLNLEKTNETFI